jgi:hypothetical protein
MSKELFLIIIEDDETRLVRGTEADCQRVIYDHLTTEAFRVMRITEGYPSRDVTDDFFAPYDEDVKRLALTAA